LDEAYDADPAVFARLHLRFHRRVAECSHYPALLKAVESTQALWSMWFCAIVPRQPAHSEGGRDHQELTGVLTHGIPEAAEAKMSAHIRLGFQQIMDGLKPYFKLRKIRGHTYSRSDGNHSKGVAADFSAASV